MFPPAARLNKHVRTLTLPSISPLSAAIIPCPYLLRAQLARDPAGFLPFAGRVVSYRVSRAITALEKLCAQPRARYAGRRWPRKAGSSLYQQSPQWFSGRFDSGRGNMPIICLLLNPSGVAGPTPEIWPSRSVVAQGRGSKPGPAGDAPNHRQTSRPVSGNL